MTGQRFSENPFYILGLRPDCSRADLEREGQSSWRCSSCRWRRRGATRRRSGRCPRTATRSRRRWRSCAIHQRRLLHELWAGCRRTAGPWSGGRAPHCRQSGRRWRPPASSMHPAGRRQSPARSSRPDRPHGLWPARGLGLRSATLSVGALGLIIWLLYWAASRNRSQHPQGSGLGVGWRWFCGCSSGASWSCGPCSSLRRAGG